MMTKIYYLDVGYTEDTVLYEMIPKEVYRARHLTVEQIDEELDRLRVSRLVVDAGEPHIIDRLKARYIIHKLFRRKVQNDQ